MVSELDPVGAGKVPRCGCIGGAGRISCLRIGTPSIGVDRSPSTNPEGVALASRGRKPTDTGRISSSNPEGVALALLWRQL